VQTVFALMSCAFAENGSTRTTTDSATRLRRLVRIPGTHLYEHVYSQKQTQHNNKIQRKLH